ncbi:hypothetical protein YC2023_053915 [Brassica napus]
MISGSKGEPSEVTFGFIKHLRVINGLRARNEGAWTLRRRIYIDRNQPKGGEMRYLSENVDSGLLTSGRMQHLKNGIDSGLSTGAECNQPTHRGRARYNTLGPLGPKGLHPKTDGFEEGIHPTASGFQNESPSSLRVLGRESIQPPGWRTKFHPASGFQDESPSSLQVHGRKSIQPPIYEESHPRAMSFRRMKTYPRSSRKARHKTILALLVAYLRGKIAILHS